MREAKVRAIISAYQEAVSEALRLFGEMLGDESPLRSWRAGTLPKRGALDSDRKIYYSFHGVGCLVEFGEIEVDFDFGPSGEVGGFDIWRLQRFLESNQEGFPGISKEELASTFHEMVVAGELEKSTGFPSSHLYRLSGR